MTVLEVINGRPAPVVSVTVVDGAGPARTSVVGDVGSGLGLVGMRERAALIGGTVSAGPVTAGRYTGGWRVRLEIPCAATRAGQA